MLLLHKYFKLSVSVIVLKKISVENHYRDNNKNVNIKWLNVHPALIRKPEMPQEVLLPPGEAVDNAGAVLGV